MGSEIHARMQESGESAQRAGGREKNTTELDARMEGRSPLLLCKNCFGVEERTLQSPSVGLEKY